MNFLRMIFSRLVGTGADVVIWIDDQVDSAFASMARAIVVIFGCLLLHIVAGQFSPGAAQFFSAVGYLFGGAYLLFVAYRSSVLVMIPSAGYNVVRKGVRAITAPLPFTEGIELPDGMSEDQVALIYRIMWAVLGTLQLVSGFSFVFPVYAHPILFMGALGAGWGILFGALTVGVGGSWLKRYGYLMVVINLMILVCCLLGIAFDNIWGDTMSNWNDTATAWTALRTMAKTHYVMAILLFVSIVGLVLSIANLIFQKGKTGFTPAAIFGVLFLFLVFLGPWTVSEVSAVSKNTNTNTNTSSWWNSGPNTSESADYGLVDGESYKFSNDPAVYLYTGGKLHWVQSEEWFVRHYGCTSGFRPIKNCHQIYEMPSGIKPGDPILNGATIK